MNCDGRQRLRFTVDRDTLLCLNGTVQPVAPAAAWHFPAGVFIDNDNLAFLHHVVHVLLVNAVRTEQLRDVVDALGLMVHVLLALFLFHDPLLWRERLVLINLGELRDQIGQHKGVRIIRAHEIAALVR